ncbi:MAG: hypothetical protein QNJ46_26800 [Leptolyngbyaceae cyanobacterium MO_188.B28]|nr:hypothetical protein [Leptolyngbyaceae cyanobacterium MO_188.B28]
MQVIEMAQQITGRPISVGLAERRPGDPEALVGSGGRHERYLDGNPYIQI